MWWQGLTWLLLCSGEQDGTNMFQGKESKNASLKHLLDKDTNVKVAVCMQLPHTVPPFASEAGKCFA